MGLEYSVHNLSNYTDDGNHQCVIIDLPNWIDITKGENEYYYTNRHGKEQKTNWKNWMVHFDDGYEIAPCREFKTVERAVEYAIKMYVKHLKSELKKWDKVL